MGRLVRTWKTNQVQRYETHAEGKEHLFIGLVKTQKWQDTEDSVLAFLRLRSISIS